MAHCGVKLRFLLQSWTRCPLLSQKTRFPCIASMLTANLEETVNSNETTTQGQAWDQIALKQYGSEKQMAALLPANTDELDTLFFEGGISVAVPDVEPLRVKSVPPWERM